jgi:hypothetical protein
MIDPVMAWRQGRLPIELIALLGWGAWGLWMVRVHNEKTRLASGV